MRNVIVFALALPVALPVAAQGLGEGGEAFNRGDYAAALRKLKPLAEQGEAETQFALGIIYSSGASSVSLDYGEVVKWYRLAAEQGHALGQFDLGLLYFIGKGKGVTQDNGIAHMWANVATAQRLKYARDDRDFYAGTMTPTAIKEAQRLASERFARNYKNCGR